MNSGFGIKSLIQTDPQHYSLENEPNVSVLAAIVLCEKILALVDKICE
jgi:hypothetical protein